MKKISLNKFLSIKSCSVSLGWNLVTMMTSTNFVTVFLAERNKVLLTSSIIVGENLNVILLGKGRELL